MWEFFQTLFNAGGWVGGLFARLGEMTYSDFVYSLIRDISLNCVNLFTGSEFSFSLNIFSTLNEISSNEIFNTLLKLFTLLPNKVLVLMNTVIGYLMSPFALILPARTPAFIGVAVYFIFFIGFIKLVISSVSKVVSLLSGTLFGSKD